MKYLKSVLIGIGLVLTGCAGSPTPAPKAAVPKVSNEYVYGGLLPCKQCSGIETTVTLKGVDSEEAKAHTFVMNAVYQQHPRQQPPDRYTGTWEVLHGTPADPEASVLSLMGERLGEQPVTYYFQQIDAHTIELLDPQLKRFENGDSLRLTRW